MRIFIVVKSDDAIQISFGSLFWSTEPEKIWAALDVIIEKGIPFVSFITNYTTSSDQCAPLLGIRPRLTLCHRSTRHG